jgi:site-specific recombinase XerC
MVAFWNPTPTGKGSKDRATYVDDGAVAALRAWLRHRLLDDGALFCPINRGGRVTLRQLTTQAIYERFQLRARRQACPRG